VGSGGLLKKRERNMFSPLLKRGLRGVA